METVRSRLVVLLESALSIALAAVLSLFVLFKMPQGGEVSLELVPLMVLSFRHGMKQGMLAGALAGTVLLVMGGYVLHPMQALLDYPIAFACVGLTAVRPMWAGVLLASCCHIFFSILSGVYFFASFAPEGMNPWMYSFLYNAPVLGIKYVLSFAATLGIWKSMQKQFPSP